MYWEYLPDGLLRAHVDQESERAIYSYDANGNRVQALEATGIVNPGQTALSIDLYYNSLDELTKVRTPKPGVSGTYLATLLDYDLHGNTQQLTDNREENGSGSQTSAGRVFAYSYNAIDQATAQTDDFATASTTDDEQLLYTYTARGELDTQKLQKRPSGSWVDQQSSASTYYDNGILKTLTNKNGAGTTIESHTLSYIQGTTYLNGNRVSDVFQLKGPDASAQCYAVTCTQSWSYDARERVVSENSGTSTTTKFTLDVQGNVTQEVSNSLTITRTFSGQQLQTEDFSSGQDKRYLYDLLGSTDCVVKLTYSGTTCPTAGSADLLEDNIYDYKSRLLGYRAYNGSGGVTRTVDYTNDPLDRPVNQVETISGATTTYDFTYVGVTNALSKEVLTGSGATTKKYAYDVFGNRATIAEGSNRYSYVYDPHGSVSLLIDQNNSVKESYGYAAYGTSNAALTKTAAGFSNKTNPYRYTGKRLDSGSGTYDMGARRYSAATGRFLQYDVFYNALDNLGLAEDPLNQNRYALAGGNPINFVDVDGHCIPCVISGGRAILTAAKSGAKYIARGARYTWNKGKDAWNKIFSGGNKLVAVDDVVGKSFGGPGQYVRTQVPKRGADYQEQITGIARGAEYLVKRNGAAARFDAYKPGRAFGQQKLVDSKDWGAGWLDVMRRVPAVRQSAVSKMVSQAERQVQAAGKIKVEWVVSNKAAANFVRQELRDAGINRIKVVYRAKKKR